MPEDAVAVAPHVYKVLAENDRVRVLESRMKPGDKTAMHGHPLVIVVALTHAKVRFTSPGGDTAELEIPAGAAAIEEETEHTTENIGDSEVRVILVELK